MSDIPFWQRSWRLGELVLPHRLIQAPLAGISCSAFRRLFTSFLPPAYAVTEMLSSHSLVGLPTSRQQRYVHRDPQESLLCFQISGNCSQVLAQAATKAQALGADLIDLNCGCPKPKITSKGAGASLVEHPDRLIALVKAVRKANSLPMTVKLRLPISLPLPDYILMINRLAEVGVDAVIIHGRTALQHYDCSVDYAQIAEVVSKVSLPVIANGDVSNRTDLLRCFNETGADAVMIGRASIGRPWLFQSLMLPAATAPKFQSQLNSFIEHIDGLVRLEGAQQPALLQARRLLKWYFPDLTPEIRLMLFQQPTTHALYQQLRDTEINPCLKVGVS